MAFYSTFLSIHRSGVLTALTWLVPHETAAVSAQVLCTPYNHAPRHFMQRHNLLQDLSYSYAPHICRTVHTHTFQISAGQFIPIQSRLLQDSSYPYSPDFCRTVHTHTLQTSERTVHTHTLQTSAGQFIPIHSRLLKEQFIPIHSRLLQDSSYPYTLDFCRTVHTHTIDFCRTVHTHTLQTSKRTVHTLTLCKTVLSRLQFQ